MKAAIYSRPISSAASEDAIQSLFARLSKAGIEVFLYEPLLKNLSLKRKIKPGNVFSSHEDIRGKVKFLFSIGGDGTLLETITLVKDSGIPVMGINTGRLGFLSSISKDEIAPALDAVLKGKFTLDKRSLISLESPKNVFKSFNCALNEVTIQKSYSSAMITIHASVNGKFLNTYWADGLIIATPTGSTAYSLSCGGPIVMPDSENFVITPVAPHNLNVRPMIISSSDVVTLEVESRHNLPEEKKRPEFLLSLDARSEAVSSSSKLTFKKAKYQISLVKTENHDFLTALRSKLMWGADKRN